MPSGATGRDSQARDRNAAPRSPTAGHSCARLAAACLSECQQSKQRRVNLSIGLNEKTAPANRGG
jgi:hypothetical protein